MFHLIRAIIWITGLVVVGGFLLRFFHYRISLPAVQQNLEACSAFISPCQEALLKRDFSGDTCQLSCFTDIGTWFEKQSPSIP